MDDASLLARRGWALGSAPLFYNTPLHIVRGHGVYLYDADGRRYVDLYNNVPCIGHAHPAIVEAMARQQGLLNVHSRYLHEGPVALAERICALHGPQIESVIFSCSGTEANEVALRMARFATGRRGVLCSDATYHGNSELVSGLSRVNRQTAPRADIRGFPFPDLYRPPAGATTEAEIREAYLQGLALAITDLERSGEGVAALIVCSIFANEGLPNVPEGFMREATAMVRAAGGLVIADEVQSGYGRTGRWWGYMTTDFTPDIVVTGKPMGAGLPLAATAASRGLVETFRDRTGYFNTFAASPLQAAVGSAVIDVIEREGLVENAHQVGAALRSALTDRARDCGRIGEVRGKGLFLAVEMVASKASKAPDKALAIDVVDRLKARGYLTSNDGAYGNLIKIRPPLVFSRDEIGDFMAAFDQTLAEIDG